MEPSQTLEDLIATRLLAEAESLVKPQNAPEPEKGTQQLAPRKKAALRTPDFIKIEKNLISLGFFTPSSKRIKDEKSKTITFTKVIEGKRIEAKATIVPAAIYGLPVTADQDKYLALQKIINDQRQETGEVNNPITFTSAELLKILEQADAGKNYHDVSEWLDLMTNTGIISEGVVYLAGKKVWAKDRFRVFDRAVSFGRELEPGKVAEKNYVWLSQWQLENINNNYLLPVDFDAYKQLKNHISKALVPLLQIWLFASREEGYFEKRYDEICQLLRIRQYHYLSEIKRNFAPSLDELVEHEYLESWQIEKTADKKSYKVIFRHGEKFHQDRRKRMGQKGQLDAGEELKRPVAAPQESLEQQEDAPEPPREAQNLSVITAEDEQLMQRLIIDFGIAASKAFELVSLKREAAKIQIGAWQYRNANPQNRAGWMIEAIEQNYSAPPAYLEEIQKRKEREKLEAAQAATRACTICDNSGHRRVKNDRYPNGAMKKCTHDPAIENKITSDQ
jgi:hypothetical protein